MESLLSTSSVSLSVSYPSASAHAHAHASVKLRPSSSLFLNSFSSSLLNLRRRSVIVASKKLKKLKKEDKNDDYLIRPDESNGFFSEPVLKKTEVQEDGRVLPGFADVDEESFFEYLNLKMESDSKVDLMRHYEVVYLVHEKYVDQVGDVNEKVQDFISEKKGKIWRQSDWGLRRLAYKIQKASKAHYMLMNIELAAESINELKSMLDKDERVIRHLTIKRDKAIIEDCPPPPEFHTVRADMMDDEDDEFFDEEEDEEWDEDDEEWDEEDEGEEGEDEDYEDEEDEDYEDGGEDEGKDEDEEEEEEGEGEEEEEEGEEEEEEVEVEEEDEGEGEGGEGEGEEEEEEGYEGEEEEERDEDGVVVFVNDDNDDREDLANGEGKNCWGAENLVR